jgi:hypothetical protein
MYGVRINVITVLEPTGSIGTPAYDGMVVTVRSTVNYSSTTTVSRKHTVLCTMQSIILPSGAVCTY